MAKYVGVPDLAKWKEEWQGKKYKKQIQAYLNDNGRNWDQLYKDYAAAAKAKKTAPASQPAAAAE